MADKKTLQQDMIGDVTRDEMLELLKNMLKAKEEANTYYGFEMYNKKPEKMKKGGKVCRGVGKARGGKYRVR